MTTDTERDAYIVGLQLLAELLNQHPDLPVPTHGSHEYLPLDWIGVDRDTMRLFATTMPGVVEKDYGDGSTFAHLRATLAGLHVRAYADRAEVCERVVVGTTTVTEEVPDADALAAVPTMTVIREVERVEWRCLPLLADAGAGGMTAQPRERGVPCLVCKRETWNNSAVCTADTVPAPVVVKAATT